MGESNKNPFMQQLLNFREALLRKNNRSPAFQKYSIRSTSFCLCIRPDMIFVNKFTQPQFLAQKIYAKKSITRDKIKSATKQRKCPKMAILRHLGVEMDN